MSRTHTDIRITADRDTPFHVMVGFHLDVYAWIAAYGRDSSLHLLVQHGDAWVRFSPADRDAITHEDARQARKLATEAARYADEVEQALADQQASPAA